jgi:putative MATE family efflux protein
MIPSPSRDVTQGSLTRSILGLTWPITISQMLFMLPGVYDAIWLGKLGPGAQAAAGLTMSVRITMISVIMALSVGSAAVVSRFVGARDQDGANLAAFQAIVLKIVASGALGVAGIVLVRPLMILGGADPDTLPLAVRYARIIFAGLIAMEMIPSIGYMLNAAGAPQVLLGMSLCSTGTLLVAEPLLVNAMGLEGAALAMVGANSVGALFGLAFLVSGRAPVRLDLRELRLDFSLMGRILRVAAPAVIQSGAPNLAMMLLTRFVSWYGAPTLAAWVIAQRIYGFALIPSVGLARTAPAMVGQNLGAAQPERAGRSVVLIARAAAVVAGAIIGVLILLAPQVLALFSGDGETLSVGVHVIQVLGLGYLAFALTNLFDASLSGAGDTLSPMVINLLALWLFQVPVAYLLSRLLRLGADGIWLALVLGWCLQAVLMGLRFRQGHWKKKRV